MDSLLSRFRIAADRGPPIYRQIVDQPRAFVAGGQLSAGDIVPSVRDGTTHILLEPLDFLARLAALVPPPRIHLTRYHGVFAPHAALRAAITPAGRGQGARDRSADGERPPLAKHVAMSWAQRLKRVFAIEIERCRRCGGRLKVIASIEEPALIERILAHLKLRAEDEHTRSPFAARAPPQPSLF